MTSIRFPLSLKDYIQSSLQWYDPNIKVSFTEFIDPATNISMVDMEYDPTQIPEELVQTLQDWIKNRGHMEFTRPKTIIFNHLLNEDHLKAVVHTLNTLGYNRFKIGVDPEFMETEFTLF